MHTELESVRMQEVETAGKTCWRAFCWITFSCSYCVITVTLIFRAAGICRVIWKENKTLPSTLFLTLDLQCRKAFQMFA